MTPAAFYTPEALVSLIIERTVGPAVRARADAFAQTAERLSHDRHTGCRPAGRTGVGRPGVGHAGAEVCDPAMGSGHFLVSLVDWLADRVLQATAGVRARILDEARARRWPIVEE